MAKKTTKEVPNVLVKEPEFKKVEQTIYTAIFAIQNELRFDEVKIPRNGTNRNGDRTYKYATLDDTLAAISKYLGKYGISIIHQTTDEQFITRIIHVESGTEISSSVPLGNPSNMQDLGGRITYLRRYMITMMMSLSVEDDTDASNKVAPGTLTVLAAAAAPVIEAPATPIFNSQEETAIRNVTESDAFAKGASMVKSCLSIEALEVLKGTVKGSKRLTDDEKDALAKLIKLRAVEIIAKK